MSLWEMLSSITFWTERAHCLMCETHYGMQGKSISGLHKELWDVWEERNMEKEWDQGGTNTWKGGIRVISIGHMQTMQTSVRSGHAPHRISTVYPVFSLNYISNSFPAWRDSVQCACVYGRLHASNWSQTRRSVCLFVCLSVVPATREANETACWDDVCAPACDCWWKSSWIIWQVG